VNVTYAYTLANSNGCTSSQNLVVTVKPAPVAAFIADQSVCAGSLTNPIVFTSNLANTTFNWFVTDPTIGISSAFGTGNIAPFIATNNGTGQLNANVQVTPSLNGCTGATVTAARITVNRAITASIIESAPTIACPNQTVGPFVGSIPQGGDGYNYNFQWQVSADGINYTNIPGAVSRQLNYPGITANEWFRMSTVSGGCTAVTNPVAIPLMPNPVITFTSTDGYNINIGNSTQVFASGGISYVWAPRNLVSDYTSSSPRLAPTVDTRFTVYVTNQQGCSDTAGVTVYVTTGYAIYPNNVITPNGDGYNDTWKIKNIEYYPNNLILIYNTQGSLVKTLKNYTKNDWGATAESGGKLSSGTYYYVITLYDGSGNTVGAQMRNFITILN
jgi:gliding motility-associated-like protein